jgi:hypothetical protein
MKPSTRISVALSRLALVGFGAVLGAGAMLVAYPFVFPPPVAGEALPALTYKDAPAAARKGFRFDESAAGRDPIHWANGSGSFVKTDAGWVLRLHGDFKAGPGPNFWIYLNRRAVAEESDFRADAGRLKLTQLRAFEGAQDYQLPAGVDPSDFHTLTIWCETFGAYIASGAIEARPGPG